MRTVTLMTAFGMAVGTLGLGTAEAGAQSGQDFRWTGRLASGQTLEIRGVSGSIRAEAASGAEAEVIAVKRARRSNPDDVRIEVVPHDGGVTICAIYPESRGGRPNECRPGGGRNSSRDNDVNVEWTVRVPAGVRLGVHTVNGDVDVKDVRGDVRATTVNGSVDVRAAGLVEANTVNGSIRAAMGRADWSGTMKFHTVNGGITLDVPASLSAEIEASTVNGAIETDFPITVQGRFSAKRMRGTIGTGGRELELETVNGSIRLHKAG